MTNKTRFSVCVLAALVCVASAASDLKPTPRTADNWAAFWASVKIDPPPPRNFLDVSFSGRVDNLTDGKISNETARRWVLADLRRGAGDMYSALNLREDIVNAGIFGPPGLNGTDRGIQSMRKKGIAKIEAPTQPDVVAAAVIAVPKKMQEEDPHAGLTDYVVVLLYRSTRGKATAIYLDGHREVMEDKSEGALSWQLDTGHYFAHSMLGPLWYQKNGWSCKPDETVVGKLCGRVKP